MSLSCWKELGGGGGGRRLREEGGRGGGGPRRGKERGAGVVSAPTGNQRLSQRSHKVVPFLRFSLDFI